MNAQSASITSVATSVPRFSVSNRFSAEFAAKTLCVGDSNSRKVKAIYRRSGIQSRGSVLLEEAPSEDLIEHEFYPPADSDHDRGPTTKCRIDRYAQEAPLLAQQASRAALQRCGVQPHAITHLVTASCTGFNAPGIDVSLIQQLGLPLTTERIHVGFMGCHALVNALRAANGLIAADDQARVLVCAVELCSLHLQYGTHPDRVVSNALFADGSGAMVLESSERSNGIAHLAATASRLIPDSTDAMTWRIGDNGFEMTLSAQVPFLIEQHLSHFVIPWLAKHGETVHSVGGWAVHPGGPRILNSVQDALSLKDDDLSVSRQILAERGNMSSATMAFILDQFVDRTQPKPWLLMAFGPGLEIELALLR